MGPDNAGDRGEQIKQAAAQYAFNRWRSHLATLPWAVAGIGIGVLGLASPYLTDRARGVWQWVYQGVVIAVSLALIAWCWAAFRGGYKKAILEKVRWIQQDAGVIVERPRFRKLRLWVLPFAYLAAFVFMFGGMLLSMRSAVRFQPLIFASSMTALGIVISFMMDRKTKAGFRPVNFIWWALYCGYAAAAAAGLPQPWMEVAQPWAWSARICGPLLVLAPVDIVVRELHSRRQFRRLQQLLAEQPEETLAHGAD